MLEFLKRKESKTRTVEREREREREMAVEVAAGESVRSLENTPTWAVATVCTCFVIISFGAERSIYGLSRVCWSISMSLISRSLSL